jgi:hypothetical protein
MSVKKKNGPTMMDDYDGWTMVDGVKKISQSHMGWVKKITLTLTLTMLLLLLYYYYHYYYHYYYYDYYYDYLSCLNWYD